MTNRNDKLSREELAELEGEPLPFRTAMSAVMPPPPLAADTRLVDGGVATTGNVLSPSTPNEHGPETGL